MAITSKPWQGTTGHGGPYSADEWQRLYRAMWGGNTVRTWRGVFQSRDDGSTYRNLIVTANGLGVTVEPGLAMVNGVIFDSATASVNLSIDSNLSGNDRIDLVVAQISKTTQLATFAVKKGSPAATPVAPEPTQTNTDIWQTPLAEVYVANGAVTLTAADITNLHQIANASQAVIGNYFNRTGAVMEPYRIVAMNAADAFGNSVRYATQHDRCIGVTLERIENSGEGEIMHIGFALIEMQASVAVGGFIKPGTLSDGMGRSSAYGPWHMAIARASGGAGDKVLCYINWGREFPSPISLHDLATLGGNQTTTAGTFGAVAGLSVAYTKLYSSSRLNVYANIPLGVDASLTDGEWRLYNVTSAAQVGPAMKFNSDNKAMYSFFGPRHTIEGLATGAYTFRVEHRRTAGAGNVVTEAGAVIGVEEILD